MEKLIVSPITSKPLSEHFTDDNFLHNYVLVYIIYILQVAVITLSSEGLNQEPTS